MQRKLRCVGTVGDHQIADVDHCHRFERVARLALAVHQNVVEEKELALVAAVFEQRALANEATARREHKVRLGHLEAPRDVAQHVEVVAQRLGLVHVLRLRLDELRRGGQRRIVAVPVGRRLEQVAQQQAVLGRALKRLGQVVEHREALRARHVEPHLFDVRVHGVLARQRAAQRVGHLALVIDVDAKERVELGHRLVQKDVADLDRAPVHLFALVAGHREAVGARQLLDHAVLDHHTRLARCRARAAQIVVQDERAVDNELRRREQRHNLARRIERKDVAQRLVAAQRHQKRVDLRACALV